MNKRTFLKTSTALLSGAAISQFMACQPQRSAPLKNWAGNLQYGTGNVQFPKTVGKVQEAVMKCDKIRALGSRHSFNNIADSDANQVSLQGLNKMISIDKSANSVTVESGMKYGELAPILQNNGFALHNLASLPHISIGGACATATHGSGVKNSNLSAAVSAIEFVDAKGDVQVLTREKDGERFLGAVVGLGALGVVTKVTLDIEPTYMMKQVVYRNLPMQELEKNFYAIMSGGYSVSLFTDWKNKNINEVWIKTRVEPGAPAESLSPEYYGAKLATQNMHPVEEQSAENCTDQMGVPGLWYERLPHFKMGFTPSTGKELQAEYFVPIENGYAALMALEKLHEQMTPHLFISEIRSIQADDLWMSPCYKKNCITLHTTFKQETETVMQLLPLIEEQLAPFNARPHWAKLFTMAPSVLQSRTEKLKDFKDLANQYDPDGKFRNSFLEKNLYA